MKKMFLVFLLSLISACTQKTGVAGLEGAVYYAESEPNCVFTFKADNQVEMSGCYKQIVPYYMEGDKVYLLNQQYTLKSNGDLVSQFNKMIRK